MGHKGLREPHILLASSNPLKIIKNLPHVLAQEQLNLINLAISKEAKLLYDLATSHFDFASTIPIAQWRQRTSRLYYAAYNCRRSLVLRCDGSFSTDSSDHNNVERIPDAVSNHSMYSKKLKDLREDRNLADYSHLAKVEDLLIPIDESFDLVKNFFSSAEIYLKEQGVIA